MMVRAATICFILATKFAFSLASDDSIAKDQPAVEHPTINLDAPAAPPESVEARLALRQYRPASSLNRFTFSGNVLEGIGAHVDHWIVMFCPGWHDKCQGLLPSYELLGLQWENKRNKELVMSSSVRFAKVDCATEKALCVPLDIDDYPSVVHYRNNQFVNSWHGGAPGLVRFIKQELDAPRKRQASPVKKTKAMSTCAMDDAPGPEKVPKDRHRHLAWLLRFLHWLISPWRSLSFALALLTTVRIAWGLALSIRTRPLVAKPNTEQQPK